MSHEAQHQDGILGRYSLPNDEVPVSHQNQSDVFSDGKSQAERVTDLTSRRLYKLADEITAARNYSIETQYLTHDEQKRNFIGDVTRVIFNREISINRNQPLTEADLKVKESEIGATIFGPMAPNEARREFFYDKRTTTADLDRRDSWFFHQEVNSSTGPNQVTLHYEVHPTGTLRVSSNPNTKNEFIEGNELKDFVSATSIYHQLVMDNMYNHDRYSSKKAA